MKNIADVNSDDILTELNSLDYGDDDLKLLDDEDIKPIHNNEPDDDLADFYMDYDEPIQKPIVPNVDLFTEKPKVEERPLDKYITPTPVSKPTLKQSVEPAKVEPNVSSVDDYLNRKGTNIPVQPTMPKPVLKETISNPLINNIKPQSQVTVPTPPIVATNNSNKVEIKDLSQLFNKVSNNVKGASEIVNRNAEIKKKIEEKFNELRKLQEQHEANKKSDYAEINAYKDEVYSKLQQKKADMEKDLIELKKGQEQLNIERKNFEDYKNTSLNNIKTLEKDFESRNKNIEQVEVGLVKRKEQLDQERAMLAKERALIDKEKASIEKERAQLTENLVQFNKLVDDFTNGIDSFNS